MTVEPVLSRVGDLAGLLAADDDIAGVAALRAAEGVGRPVGNADFIADLEQRLGRAVARRAPGRKPQMHAAAQLRLI